LLQTNDGIYYEFRVDKVSKSMKKPLDGIRAQVVADWRDEEVSIRLKKLAADVLKRANSGESMSVIAASLGVSVVTSDPVPRYGKTPMFSESTVEAAGAAKKGAFFSGPVAFGKGIIVGRVSDIQFQSEPVDAPTRLAYIQRLGQAFVSDFVEQFENGVREDAGTTIDEARFQSFHNNE
jgi:peptidyl-prolyl cis-trans isomerase D